MTHFFFRSLFLGWATCHVATPHVPTFPSCEPMTAMFLFHRIDASCAAIPCPTSVAVRPHQTLLSLHTLPRWIWTVPSPTNIVGCAHHKRVVMAEQALDLARADLLLHTDGIPAACSSYYASTATCVAKATSLAVVCAETNSDTKDLWGCNRFKDQLP